MYERVKMASHREGRSITAFVQEAVTEKLTEEDRDLLFEAFSLVAEDAEEADVRYAQDAQREVVLKA
jgi:predicted DNA-binding protein